MEKLVATIVAILATLGITNEEFVDELNELEFGAPQNRGNVVRNITPEADSLYHLGTSSSRWLSGWFDNTTTTFSTNATTRCFGNDCINSWAAAGSATSNWEINSDDRLTPTTTRDVLLPANATITDHFTVGTSTFFIDSDEFGTMENNKIGFGTAAPLATGHFFLSGDTFTPNAGTTFIAQNSADTDSSLTMSLISGDDGRSTLSFGTEADSVHGRIFYEPDEDGSVVSNFRHLVNGVETMRLLEGKVGILSDSPDFTLHVGETTGVQRIGVESTDDTALITIDSNAAGKESRLGFINGGGSVWRFRNLNNTDNLHVYEDKTLNADIMTWETGTGFVGINTTTPDTYLEVAADDASTTIIRATDKDNGYWVGLGHGNTVAQVVTHPESARLDFDVGDTDNAMTIDDGGNVGIGDTAPVQKLHVEESNGGGLALVSSDTTVTANVNIGRLFFRTNDSDIGSDVEVARIQAKAQGEYTAGNAATALIFYTSSDGSGTTVERVRIEGNGDVGIGTDNPNSELTIKGTDGEETFNVRNAGNETIFRVFPSADGDSVLDLEDNNSVLVHRLHSSSTTEWNQQEKDLDFVINADGLSNAFFLQASSGNIGIGTSNPSVALDVVGQILSTSSGGGNNLSLVESGNANADILFTDNGGQTAQFVLDRTTNDLEVNVSDGDFIIENDNVGIGMIDPAYKLQVLTVSNHAISIEEASGNEDYQMGVDSAGDLNFYNSGEGTAETFEILDNNNVRVGDGLFSVCDGGGCPAGDTATADGDIIVEGDAEIDGVLDLDETSDFQFVAGSATACTTQCGTDACIVGFLDVGASQRALACATATNDDCVCSN